MRLKSAILVLAAFLVSLKQTTAQGIFITFDKSHYVAFTEPPSSNSFQEVYYNGQNDIELDPIYPVSGELRIQKTDITIPSKGFPFNFVRCYKSGIEYNGPLGQKWDFNLNSRLILDTDPNPDTIERYDGGACRSDTFTKNSQNNFDPAPGICERIEPHTIGYQLVDPWGGKLIFESCGTDGTKTYFRLKYIEDRNGNAMGLSYDGSTSTSKLTGATDTNGRGYTFTYNSTGRLEYIKDFGTTQRKIKYVYSGSNSDQLTEVIELEGESTLQRKTTYTYDSLHRVETITDAKQNASTGTPVPFIRNYWSGYRVIAQEYGPSAGISGQQSDAYIADFSNLSSNPRHTKLYNRLGHETRFYFDQLGLCTKKVFENGANDVEETFVYDSLQNCTEFVRGEGNKQLFTYDTNNSNPLARKNLLSESSTNSSGGEALTTTYTYESSYNQVSTITLPTGRVDKLEYDELGNLTKKLADYGSGRLNLTTTYSYDSSTHLLSTVTDPRGKTSTYEYDTRGYLIKTIGDTGTGGLNQTISELLYDEFGNLTQSKDANGKSTTFTVNRLNQITQSTSPSPNFYATTYVYDKNDNIITTSTQNDSNVAGSGDFVVSLEYDLLDHVTSRTEDVGSGLSRTTTYSYDAEENLTLVTHPQGNKTFYEFNALDLNTTVTFGYTAATATTYHYSYDKNFRLTALQEPLGASYTTAYAYDHHGRLTKSTNSLGHYSLTSYSGALKLADEAYSSAGGASYSKLEYVYDTADRLIISTQKMKVSPSGSDIGDGGNDTQFVYDANGNVVTVKDDQNHETRTEYDGLNRVTRVTDAVGNRSNFAYDGAGNVITRVDEEIIPNSSGYDSYTTVSWYDELNRLTKSRDPAGKECTYTYGARNLITATDPNGFKSESIFDELGRLVEQKTQKTATATLSTKWEYDKNGRLTKVRDPRDFATSYAYDQNDRQTSQTFNDSWSITYVYDANSNIIERTDQNGTLIEYGYDLANRMTRKDITAGASHIGGEVSHKIFSYDALNRLTYAEDTDSKIYYTYNTASLVETEEMRYGALNLGATGKTVEWDYNALGLVTNVRYPGATSTSGQLNYAYDVKNRLTEVRRQTGASTTETLAVWTYRGVSRIEKRMNGNDTYVAATFDSRKLVSTLIHWNPDGDQKIAEFAYGYDDAARMTTEAIKVYNDSGTLIADKGLGFFYDRAARLTKLYRDVPQADLGNDPPTNYGQLVEYTLDDNSNRTTAVYTPKGGSASTEVYTTNDTNAYTNVDWPGPTSTDYDYDNAGNRTWQTDTDKSWYYDYQNKVVKVQNGTTNYCEYDYDALGRRMQKHFQYDGIDYDTTTRFYYAGAMLIQEWNVVFEGEGEDMTESSEREFEYVWGLSAAEPVQLLKYELGTGSLIESVYYHQNALASVYAITKDSANAEIRENYRYEEYGVPTINATDTNTAATSLWGNKITWHAQYYDFEVVNLASGLSLFANSARAGYDPELNGFLARPGGDPTNRPSANPTTPDRPDEMASPNQRPSVAKELEFVFPPRRGGFDFQNGRAEADTKSESTSSLSQDDGAGAPVTTKFFALNADAYSSRDHWNAYNEYIDGKLVSVHGDFKGSLIEGLLKALAEKGIKPTDVLLAVSATLGPLGDAIDIAVTVCQVVNGEITPIEGIAQAGMSLIPGVSAGVAKGLMKGVSEFAGATKAAIKSGKATAKTLEKADELAVTARGAIADISSAIQESGLAASGKGATSQLSNSELVKEIAIRAEAWGTRKGKGVAGSGPVQGTFKHKYAEKLLDRYQDRFGHRGLETEVSFLGGIKLPKDSGFVKDSVRLDVWDEFNGVIYDYKFMEVPKMTAKQIEKIHKRGPKEFVEIVLVGPK